jgi:hypothetical protein
MAGYVYSHLFYRGTLAAAELIQLYEVQDDYVVVLRDMNCLIPAAETLFNVQVGVPDDITVVWYQQALTSPDWSQWKGRTVVPAGQGLYAYSSAGGTQLVVSGYLLTA